jgi:hypothetical protein
MAIPLCGSFLHIGYKAIFCQSEGGAQQESKSRSDGHTINDKNRPNKVIE